MKGGTQSLSCRGNHLSKGASDDNQVTEKGKNCGERKKATFMKKGPVQTHPSLFHKKERRDDQSGGFLGEAEERSSAKGEGPSKKGRKGGGNRGRGMAQ